MRRIIPLVALLVATPAIGEEYDLSRLLSASTQSTLVVLNNVPKGVDVRRIANDAFDDAEYYGVVAVNSQGTHGFSHSVNSIQAATQTALDYCNDLAEGDPPCRPAAHLLPKGWTPTAFPPVTPSVVEGIREVMGLSTRGYGAVATAGEGAWGGAFNHADPDVARDLAVSGCVSWREDVPLISNADDFPCEVVVLFHFDDLPD